MEIACVPAQKRKKNSCRDEKLNLHISGVQLPVSKDLLTLAGLLFGFGPTLHFVPMYTFQTSPTI